MFLRLHGNALEQSVIELGSSATVRLGLDNVAIVTLEQIAPFPFDRVKALTIHELSRMCKIQICEVL